MDALPTHTFRRDAQVIGLVSIAHGLSHFFQLVLPPLFPLLKAEFGVSYATLGALMSVFYVSSACCQLSAGFAVDRFGGRPILLSGLVLITSGTFFAGLVSGPLWLFPCVILMGLGNGVFHPADFSLLNGRIEPRRLGHAYSAHGIGGALGYAFAPLASFGLASAFGWRFALLALGVAGLVAVSLLASLRRALDGPIRDLPRAESSLAASMTLFAQPPILLCFGFFCLLTVAMTGIQTFGATALNAAYAIALPFANSAITAYLLANVMGILAGGFLAARSIHHDRIAAACLLIGGSTFMIIAAAPAVAVAALPLLAIAGFGLGAAGPSRDLIVRSATPAGASGRVYGFVYSGLDLGATVGPLWMGMLLDHGAPRVVFGAIALCLLLAIGTVIQAKRSVSVQALPRGAD